MKRLSLLVLSLTILFGLVMPAFAIAGYDDVSMDAWYCESVEYVTQNGMMQGVGNNCFDPEGTTTRGMIAVVLHRHAGSPPAYSCLFSDLREEDWYYSAGVWCHAKEIVMGYPTQANSFYDDPNAPMYNYRYWFDGDKAVTREELACFLYRYAKYAEVDVSETAGLEGFDDAASVSEWAAEAMGWCVANGIIQGTPEGDTLNLAPEAHATRAEVATMLMRYCQMLEN